MERELGVAPIPRRSAANYQDLIDHVIRDEKATGAAPMTEPDQPGKLRSAELQRLLDENGARAVGPAGSAGDPEPAALVTAASDTVASDPAASDPPTRPIAVPSGSRPAQPEEVARLAFERQTILGQPAPAANRSRPGRLLLAGGTAAAVVALVVVTAVRFSGAGPAQPAPGPAISVLDTARATPGTSDTAATSDPAGGTSVAVLPGPPTISEVPSGPTSAPSATPTPPSTPTAGSAVGADPTPVTAPPRTVDPSLVPDGPSVLRPGDENPGTVITGTAPLTGWVPLTTAAGSAGADR